MKKSVNSTNKLIKEVFSTSSGKQLLKALYEENVANVPVVDDTLLQGAYLGRMQLVQQFLNVALTKNQFSIIFDQSEDI